MNKKELIILLLIPVYAICLTFYGAYQTDIVKTNHVANVSIANQIDELINKIKSESPEKTQANLTSHVKNTKQLVLMGLESEQLYVTAMHAFFRNTLIFSIIWFILVFLVFYKSSKRNVKANL